MGTIMSSLAKGCLLNWTCVQVGMVLHKPPVYVSKPTRLRDYKQRSVVNVVPIVVEELIRATVMWCVPDVHIWPGIKLVLNMLLCGVCKLDFDSLNAAYVYTMGVYYGSMYLTCGYFTTVLLHTVCVSYVKWHEESECSRDHDLLQDVPAGTLTYATRFVSYTSITPRRLRVERRFLAAYTIRNPFYQCGDSTYLTYMFAVIACAM